MSKRDLWKFRRAYALKLFLPRGREALRKSCLLLQLRENIACLTSWRLDSRKQCVDHSPGDKGLRAADRLEGHSTSEQHSRAMRVLLEAWKPNLASRKQTYWTVLLLALFSAIAHHLSLASASIIVCTFDWQLQPPHTTKSQLQPSHPGVCLWSESCVFGTPVSYDKLSAFLPEYRA